jgi:hypothetical protein
MSRNIRADELKKGDEFFYRGELHRVTVNHPSLYTEGERKIYTYVVERPLTAPFVIWWPNDQTVTVE